MNYGTSNLTSCEYCSARNVCAMAGTLSWQSCRNIPLIKTMSATYYTAADTQLLIPLMSLPSDRFILDVEQVLTASNTMPLALAEQQAEGDELTMLPLYDRHGNYVRTDALARTILARRSRTMSCFAGSTTRFKAVLGSDPARVNILDCILPSIFTPAVTAAAPADPEAAAAASVAAKKAVAKASS